MDFYDFSLAMLPAGCRVLPHDADLSPSDPRHRAALVTRTLPLFDFIDDYAQELVG